jgi:acetyl esterase/lipase
MADGIDDVRSFWKWIEQEVQRILQNSPLAINLDVRNLLIGGESAGGYHTAQTALLGMTTLPIKVLFVQYPGIDLDSMLQAPDKLGDKAEQNALFDEEVPFSVVEEHLASVAPGTVCARAKFGTRMHLMRSLVQAGKFCDFSGDRAWISPMNSLDTAPKLPPILLYHSKEDEAVSTDIMLDIEIIRK